MVGRERVRFSGYTRHLRLVGFWRAVPLGFWAEMLTATWEGRRGRVVSVGCSLDACRFL